MKKDKRGIQIMLFIYICLYIFIMINREFTPFGFDLRFILLPLGCFIVILNLINNKGKVILDKSDKTGNYFILFYLAVFLSNVSWLWNGLNVNEVKFFNEILLLINTFVGILVIYFNKNNIDFEKLIMITIISCTILSVSIFIVYVGVPFEKIMGDPKEPAIYYGNDAVPQKNLFGDNFRCAGYASDPNYATILLVYGIICAIKSKKLKKWAKTIFIIIFSLAVGLSFSKTVIAGSIIALIYILIFKKYKNISEHKKILNRTFILLMFFLIFFIPILNLDNYFPMTLTTRFAMWEGAQELFIKSPLIGSGITSFRTFFEISHSNWYVQCHSTFWQVLSETGLIGLFFYSNTLINALDKKEKLTSYFLVIVFIIWSMTYETIALPLSTFALYIFELENEKEKLNEGEKN